MASRSNTMNWAGVDLVVNRLITGKVKPHEGELMLADTVTAGAVLGKASVINITTSATRTLTADESGSLVLLNKADGIVFTMPATTVGLYFDFVVNTTVTSNAYKWSTATQGTEFFNGTFNGMDQDGTVTSGVPFTGDGSTHDNISMNGTTTGGRVGTQFRLTCTAANLWTVTGLMAGNGTIATPFATS